MHCDPLPDWDWDWVALGWPKGHPSVTQGPPKRDARVDLRKCFVCNTSWKRPGGVGAQSALIAGNADIARNRRDREGKISPRLDTDNTDQEWGRERPLL